MDTISEARELLSQLGPGTAAERTHAPSMTQIKRISYTHDAMVDLIISHPGITQNDIAAHFGYTPAWVCHIIASDAFQAKLDARKDVLIDPQLRATIKEKFEALVQRSLAVLQEKLNKPTSGISDQLAIRAAELGARSLGLGREAVAPNPPGHDRLTILADRLVILQSKAKEPIDGQAQRITESDLSPQGRIEDRGPESQGDKSPEGAIRSDGIVPGVSA